VEIEEVGDEYFTGQAEQFRRSGPNDDDGDSNITLNINNNKQSLIESNSYENTLNSSKNNDLIEGFLNNNKVNPNSLIENNSSCDNGKFSSLKNNDLDNNQNTGLPNIKNYNSTIISTNTEIDNTKSSKKDHYANVFNRENNV